MWRGVAVLLVLLCLSPEARAQCPDGSPPPCGRARRAPPSAATRARHLLLLPFRNVTRRPDQDWLLAGAPLMIGQVLGQFRDLEVVSDEALAAARHKIGLAVDAMPDAAQLRALAEETGGWTAITGNVFAAGNRLRITARASDIASSRVLAQAQAEVAVDADARAAFDTLSLRLVDPTVISTNGESLAAMTTGSIDAFRAYARGLEMYQRDRFREAESEFARAISLDSTFALAWSALAAATAGGRGVQALLDPRSVFYRAVEHAANLSQRLPPREAVLLRAVQAFSHGEARRARHLLDSLLAGNPDFLDAAYYVAIMQGLAPPVDTSVTPPRLQSSPARAVALVQMILERDPRRRIVYLIPIYIYGLGGGLMWGDIFGHTREFGSFAAQLLMPPDAREVPVVRSATLELVPRSTFDSLPTEEQQRLRRRSADRAWDWVERWLVAGPEDADAHLWAARIAGLREDYERALAELRTADSIGVQSAFENRSGWKLSLLMLAGHSDSAVAMADSMLAAGTLTNTPFMRTFDLRRGYGAAALVLAKRWDRVAKMAQAMGPPPGQTQACESLRREMIAFVDAGLPPRLRRAVMDTVSAHAAEVSANPTLAPCVTALSTAMYSFQ